MDQQTFDRIKSFPSDVPNLDVAMRTGYSRTTISAVRNARDLDAYRATYLDRDHAKPPVARRDARYDDGLLRHPVTEEVWRLVRLLSARGLSRPEIANITGSSLGTITEIRHGDTWEEYCAWRKADSARKMARAREASARHDEPEPVKLVASPDPEPVLTSQLAHQIAVTLRDMAAELHELNSQVFALSETQRDQLDVLRDLLAAWAPAPVTARANDATTGS